MAHHGKKLKKIVVQEKPNRQRLADHLGINKDYLYHLYRQEKIKWKYLRMTCEFLDLDPKKQFPDIPATEFFKNKYKKDLSKKYDRLFEAYLELQKKHELLLIDYQKIKSKRGAK